MKKHISVLFILLTANFLFFSSFIGVGSYGDTPGFINAIGEAGSPNTFTFNKWEITKAAMPEGKVENIQVEIEINTSSLSTDWKDLEKNVKKKKDYFYVKKFPKATVVLNGAEAQGDGSYVSDAMLTLKGRSPDPLSLMLNGPPLHTFFALVKPRGRENSRREMQGARSLLLTKALKL